MANINNAKYFSIVAAIIPIDIFITLLFYKHSNPEKSEDLLHKEWEKGHEIWCKLMQEQGYLTEDGFYV